jgi:hypothetical protein
MAADSQELTQQEDSIYQAQRLDSDVMINELYERGVTIRDIFGKFYEREAAADARTMLIEDAELSGVIVEQAINKERPF